ncbi:MAG: hypothetical protein JXA95_03065, partial [Spirochaetales bacterium]|nr:hypothetical protein [Spirochaetales bacterium]
MADFKMIRGSACGIVISFAITFFVSCGNDPLKQYEPAFNARDELVDVVHFLYGKNLSAGEILEGLDKVEKLLPQIQDVRDRMGEEADRLTVESYELHSGNIEKLKEGRMELYQGIDAFLVCSYHLSDVIELSVYYNDHRALYEKLRKTQKDGVSIVQGDAPHSAKSTFSYYKNLDKITGQTADPEGGWFYTVKVNIGYNFNEKDTQTLLNSSKMALAALIRSYFSGMTKDEVMTIDENIIKAGLVMVL